MFEDKELDELMKKQETSIELEAENVEKLSEDSFPAVVQEQNPIATPTVYEGLESTLGKTKNEIVKGAKDILNQKKGIKKHSKTIADIANEGLKAEEQIERLKVEEINADNRVRKQEIKNRLIVLKAEAKRLKKEQKQLNKDQKAQHKKRNADAKWEVYGEKLTKMKYDYVPNPFVLKMLLMFDGIVSFFNGVGATSTAIMKALKWVLLIIAIIAVLMIIPVSREWLLGILKFN